MIASIRSEWLKLRTVTSSVVLLIAVVGVSIGIGLLATASVPLNRRNITVADRLSIALAGVNLSLFLLAVTGVLLITQEFRFGTVRLTFVAVPKRARVVLAKAAVLASSAVVLSALMVAITVLLGAAVLSGRSAPIDFSLSGTPRVLVAGVILAALYVLAGLAVGAVVRSQPVAIAIVILWPLLVEGIVGGIFPSVGKWLPFRAAGAMLSIQPGKDFLNPWVGALYLACVVLVLLVVGIVLTIRRDA